MLFIRENNNQEGFSELKIDVNTFQSILFEMFQSQLPKQNATNPFKTERERLYNYSIV